MFSHWRRRPTRPSSPRAKTRLSLLGMLGVNEKRAVNIEEKKGEKGKVEGEE